MLHLFFLVSTVTGLQRSSTYLSNNIEFGDNEHTDSLVKARTHTQALFVGAPVQAGDRLSGQSDIL